MNGKTYRFTFFAVAALLAVVAGCATRPAGESAERKRLEEAGHAWTEHVEVPPLPGKPTLDDYLQHALLSNADLQARYWQWRSAVEQIPQVSAWPRIAIPFSVMFSKTNMKLWDRATLGVSNDPMTNIPPPSKLQAKGRQALEEARAAAARFEEAKFVLQGRVMSTYYDLALLGESIRIREEDVALLRLIAQQAATRVSTGRGTQQELLRAQTELQLAENEVANLRAQAAPMAAAFNALLNRAADAPVGLPEKLPEPRPLPVADADLIRIGSERSPELAALASEVAGRKEALELARLAYLPDFSLSASITGTIAQTLGGMIVLPTQRAAIRAGIAAADADLKAAAAARMQYRNDLAARFVLNLYVLRNDERQVELFEKAIIPRSRQAVQAARESYTAGRADFTDLIEAQRTLLDTRLVAARLRTEREKALVSIETWSAVDIETLAPKTNGVRSPSGMR